MTFEPCLVPSVASYRGGSLLPSINLPLSRHAAKSVDIKLLVLMQPKKTHPMWLNVAQCDHPFRCRLPYFIPHIVPFGYPSSFIPSNVGNVGGLRDKPASLPSFTASSMTCIKTMSINVHVFRPNGPLLL